MEAWINALRRTGQSPYEKKASTSRMMRRAQSRRSIKAFESHNIDVVSEGSDKLDLPTLTWDLDVLEIENPIMQVATVFVRKHAFLERYNIAPEVFFRYCALIEQGYVHDNPYHNQFHGADVMNSVHYILEETGLRLGVMNSAQFYGAILAALVHDFKHPGYTNKFLIDTRHAISLRYSDDSVLERMHVAEAYAVAAENQDADIFASMSKKDYLDMRKVVIDLVLATDLKDHFSFIESLNTMHTMSKASSESSSETGEGDGSASAAVKVGANILAKIAIKMADLGHCAKPVALHRKWTARVVQEFFRQGDEEKKLGIDVLPHMDRAKGI